MTFSEIFSQYYTLYRGESETPATTDDEWTIGIRLANHAIKRWENYDNMFWKQLFTDTSTSSTGGTLTTTADTATYAAPTAMKIPGGYVKLLDGTTTVKHVPIISSEEVQFKSDNSNAAYFIGDPSNGYTLKFIKAPDTTGLTIFYPFYKKATLVVDGDSIPEMLNDDFIVQHMLADRYRISRNPYYGTAKRDAENLLGQMKMTNDSGTPANPWSVPDNSGSVWGQDAGTGWSF